MARSSHEPKPYERQRTSGEPGFDGEAVEGDLFAGIEQDGAACLTRRTTLHRNQRLRAVIDDHRIRQGPVQSTRYTHDSKAQGQIDIGLLMRSTPVGRHKVATRRSGRTADRYALRVGSRWYWRNRKNYPDEFKSDAVALYRGYRGCDDHADC